MLPCNGCAYRKTIPGNAHIRCTFDWIGASDEIKSQFPEPHSERVRHWFVFPLNYDPTWGPNECPAKSDKAEHVAPPNPFADLLSLLH